MQQIFKHFDKHKFTNKQRQRKGQLSLTPKTLIMKCYLKDKYQSKDNKYITGFH